jgi:hypothetical protein
METVSIRNLRGASLQETARSGKPLAITNHRVLIGVFIPVATAWLEHLIDLNWSQVRDSIAEGEQAMASDLPMATLGDLAADVAGSELDEPGDYPMPRQLAIPLAAAMTGQVLTQSPQGQALIERMRAALTVPVNGQVNSSAEPTVRTVRIGDLTAGLIEQVGLAGQTVAITHERQLIGIVIPVTPGLVQFLIEQNLYRVIDSIRLAEKQLQAPAKLTTLDDVGSGCHLGPA